MPLVQSGTTKKVAVSSLLTEVSGTVQSVDCDPGDTGLTCAVTDPTSNPVITLGGAVSPEAGGTGLVFSNMSTAAADNSTALQAVIDGLLAQATTDNTTLGVPSVNVPAGVYSVDAGITSYPWVHLLSFGNVRYDFTSLSSSGTAFRILGNGSPTADFANRNTGNRAPFIGGANGSTLLWGPGKATTSRGIDLGNSSSSSSASVREASLENTHVMQFGTCLFLRNIDDYLINMRHVTFEQCGTIINTSSGTTVNSGERMSFEDFIFAGANAGLIVNTDALDFNFHNGSWDFVAGPIFTITAGGFGKVSYENNHFEAANKPLFLSTMVSSTKEVLILKDNKWVTTVNSPQINAPNGPAWSGPMSIDVDGWYVGGFGTTSNAAEGMFMVDDDVTINKFTGVTFNAWKQLIASQTLLNSDPYFSCGTATADLATDVTGCWTVSTSSLITAITDAGTVWSAGGATKALKLTSSNASGSFYVVKSDRFRVRPGQRLLADIAFYGGTSTGTGVTALKFYFFKEDGTTTNDGVAFGDSMNTIYNQSSDPAYTGNRLWWAKPNNLREAQVPAGYEYAQLEVTMAAFLGDAWLGFAGVSSLSGE